MCSVCSLPDNYVKYCISNRFGKHSIRYVRLVQNNFGYLFIYICFNMNCLKYGSFFKLLDMFTNWKREYSVLERATCFAPKHDCTIVCSERSWKGDEFDVLRSAASVTDWSSYDKSPIMPLCWFIFLLLMSWRLITALLIALSKWPCIDKVIYGCWCLEQNWPHRFSALIRHHLCPEVYFPCAIFRVCDRSQFQILLHNYSLLLTSCFIH